MMEPRSCVYQGYLRKSPPEKKMASDRWQKRWFKLWSDQVLEYYKSNTDKKPLKNPIDLTQCKSVSDGIENYTKYYKTDKIRWPFCLDMPGRLYILLAYSEEERTVWKEKICELCSLPLENANLDYSHDWPTGKSSPNISSNSSQTGSDSSEAQHRTFPITIPSTPKENRSNFINHIVSDDSWSDEHYNYDELPPPREATGYDELPPPREATDYDELPPPREATDYDELPPPRPVAISKSFESFDNTNILNTLSNSYNEPFSCRTMTDSSESDQSLSRNDSDLFMKNIYDVPPPKRYGQFNTYDMPPPPPNNDTYDVPPTNVLVASETYDIPPRGVNYDVPPNANYDIPPHSANYDIPPHTANYDLPPHSANYDVPPHSANYDVPPHSANYDVPPHSANYDVPPHSANYDVPPHSANYDIVSYDIPPLRKNSPSTNLRVKQPSTKVAHGQEGYVQMDPSAESPSDEYIDMEPLELTEGYTLMNGDEYIDVGSTGFSPPKGPVKEFRPIGTLDRWRVPSTRSSEVNTIGGMTTNTIGGMTTNKIGGMSTNIIGGMSTNIIGGMSTNIIGGTTTNLQRNLTLDTQVNTRNKSAQENIADPPAVDRKMKPPPTVNRSTKPKLSTGENSFDNSSRSTTTSTGYFNFSPPTHDNVHDTSTTTANINDVYINNQNNATRYKSLHTKHYNTLNPYSSHNDNNITSSSSSSLPFDTTNYYKDTNNNQFQGTTLHNVDDPFAQKSLPTSPCDENTDPLYMSPPSKSISIDSYENVEGFSQSDLLNEDYENFANDPDECYQNVTQVCPDSPEDDLSYIQLAAPSLTGNNGPFFSSRLHSQKDGYIKVDALKSAAAKDLR